MQPSLRRKRPIDYNARSEAANRAALQRCCMVALMVKIRLVSFQFSSAWHLRSQLVDSLRHVHRQQVYQVRCRIQAPESCSRSSRKAVWHSASIPTRSGQQRSSHRILQQAWLSGHRNIEELLQTAPAYKRRRHSQKVSWLEQLTPEDASHTR